MIFSMTGYGSSREQIGAMEVYVELVSINSKQLDIKSSVPEIFSETVFQWKKELGSQLKRGNIKLSIQCTNVSDFERINKATKEKIKMHYQALAAIASEVGATTDLFRLALSMTQCEKPTTQKLDAEELERVGRLVEVATQHCIRSREQEGANLQQQLVACLEELSVLLATAEKYASCREDILRKRLEKRIKIREDIVELDRWEQEVLYYLEKMDVAEEIIRLKSHLAYFAETMQAGGRVGKKLGFITQEMGREINTIGAKAQDVNLQHTVVKMKDIQEQIKEQLCNIL